MAILCPSRYCVLLNRRWHTMRDYMKALHYRFETPSERAENLERATKKSYRKLAKKLEKPERKMLLRLVDLEAALRDEACLDSFMSGYRLAHGIHQELLADQPPYNFEDEDERNAIEKIKTEKTGG